MDLVVDIGNTYTKIAVFTKAQRAKDAPDSILYTPTADDIRTNEALKELIPRSDRIIVSNVGESDMKEWQDLLSHQSHIIFNHLTPIPIQNDYLTPETLGLDRLASVVGATMYLPQGEGGIVVDAGTCIKLDILSPDHVYVGGNISPGLHMRIAAMHEKTAKLPLVNMDIPKLFYGVDTISALQNGGLRGGVFEISEFCRKAKRTFGIHRKLLTGGDADLISKHWRARKTVIPHLVLIGLRRILNYAI